VVAAVLDILGLVVEALVDQAAEEMVVLVVVQILAVMEQQTLVEVAVVVLNNNPHHTTAVPVETAAQDLFVFVIQTLLMLQALQQVLHLFLHLEDIESISGPHLGVSRCNGTLCRNR
tara:strand:+ start:226 stop:576 length:351 start_codon:yes stop_codon:yes gene_type:complete